MDCSSWGCKESDMTESLSTSSKNSPSQMPVPTCVLQNLNPLKVSSSYLWKSLAVFPYSDSPLLLFHSYPTSSTSAAHMVMPEQPLCPTPLLEGASRMDRQSLSSHPKGLIHGGDDICGGESLLDFSRSTRKARDEEENCLVGAVWTLAWVPAAARVHQTRPGSAPKEGTLEEEAGDL